MEFAPVTIPPSLPPLPGPDEDFNLDRAHFKEVSTLPEQIWTQERSQEAEAIQGPKPIYQRHAGAAHAGEALAGLFSAAALGLLGARMGQAIDPGDENRNLGGFHGPAVGALLGTYLGSSLGTWGAGRFTQRPTGPGQSAGGAALGTVLGTAFAFGIAAGFEQSDGASGAAVAGFMLLQTGFAVLFNDLFE